MRALAAAVAVLALTAGTAQATIKTPGYEGVKKAPKVKPPKLPKPLVLAEHGRHPQVLVDEAGTAHIVWTDETTVHEADITRYCRVRRGATACDVAHGLVPPQEGDPAGNSEFSPPRVLASGDDLLIVSYRYPNVVNKPDGASSGATYLWTSDDGGATITGPALVGDQDPSGVPVVFGSGESPRIGLISDTQTGGTFFSAISPGTYNGRVANLAGSDGNRALSGSLAVRGERPVAAFGSLGGQIFVREWMGTGDIHDAATWSELAPYGGSEPRLASGPAGLFILDRPPQGAYYEARRIDGNTIGPPTRVTPDGANGRDFFQDADGRIFAGWVQFNEETRLEARIRNSRDGRRWLTTRPVGVATKEQDRLGFLDMAAASDGGGFAVFVRAGSGRDTVLAAQFGNKLATGKPGLGSLAGEGIDPGVETSCQHINFSDVRVITREGCFFTATTGPKGTKVSDGTVRINGIDFVPDPGVRILINPKERTIDSTGKVTVQGTLAGDSPVVFVHDKLALKLPPAGASAAQEGAEKHGIVLMRVDSSKYEGLHLKGFPIHGAFELEIFEDGSAKIGMALELEKAFGGITGDVELEADNEHGLKLESLKFRAKEVPIFGVLLIEDFALKYEGEGNKWSSSVRVTTPPIPTGPKIGGSVVFREGKFEGGTLGAGPPFPGLKIAPGVFLTYIGGGFLIDPPTIIAEGAIGAIPLPDAKYVTELSGRAQISFGNPITYQIGSSGEQETPEGQEPPAGAIGTLYDWDVASGFLKATTDGFAALGGEMELDLDAVSVGGELEASLHLDVNAQKLNFTGRVLGEICITEFCHLSGEVLLSDRGAGACITTGVTYGFVYEWGDSPLDVDLKGPLSCDLSEFQSVEVKKEAGKPEAAEVSVPTGVAALNLKVEGSGGAPAGVVVSPTGERIEPVDVKAAGPDTRAVAITLPNRNTTFIGVRSPQAGAWRFEARPGSPPVTEVGQASALPAPGASGNVGGGAARASGGSPRKRELSYRVTRREGLKVTFLEVGNGVTAKIGEATKARGTISFTPARGPRGKRTILAVGEQDGLPRFREEIDTYTAPPPAPPGRVRGVRVRRAKGGIVVSWRRSANADAYAVRVAVRKGPVLFNMVGAKTRRVRFGDVLRGTRVDVTVTARDNAGRTGRPGKARL